MKSLIISTFSKICMKPKHMKTGILIKTKSKTKNEKRKTKNEKRKTKNGKRKRKRNENKNEIENWNYNRFVYKDSKAISLAEIYEKFNNKLSAVGWTDPRIIASYRVTYNRHSDQNHIYCNSFHSPCRRIRSLSRNLQNSNLIS